MSRVKGGKKEEEGRFREGLFFLELESRRRVGTVNRKGEFEAGAKSQQFSCFLLMWCRLVMTEFPAIQTRRLGIQIIDWIRRRKSNQPIVLPGPELGLFIRFLRPLRPLLYLLERELLLRQQIIHRPRVFGSDVIHLRQILHLNLGMPDEGERVRRVLMRVLPRPVVHDAVVELAGLIVFGELAFVRVMRFARDDIVGYGVWGFGHVRAELVGEAVRYVLRVAGMVAVNAHLTVEVEGGIGAGHEGAIDFLAVRKL